MAPAPDVTVAEVGATAPDAGSAEDRGPRDVRAQALAALARDAESNGSSALVILQDGKTLGAWSFGEGRGPIETMSITKAVLSLAVGTLIDAGKLRLDHPVHDFFPEWSSARQRQVTVAHLLGHVSGLEPEQSTRAIYESRSFLRHSLRTKLTDEPGTRYVYSNRGANLLAAIIGKASGERADRYVSRVLLAPLGIRTSWWSLDRERQPHGLAGLHLLPEDLAKLGQLVLQEGRWGDRVIVSKEWIARSTRTPGAVQPRDKRLALMWWLIPDTTRGVIDDAIVAGWRAANVDDALVGRASTLRGKTWGSVHELGLALRELFDEAERKTWTQQLTAADVAEARWDFGPAVGTYAAGTLGQWLVILPRDRLVAVRMRRSPKNAAEKKDEERTFPDFIRRVRGLVE